MIDWNLGDILDAIEPAVPEDAPALIHGDRIISWPEMSKRSNNLARNLRAQGAGDGAKIAFYMRNRSEYGELMAACFKGRLTHVNINYRYRPEEVFYIFDDSWFLARAEALRAEAVEREREILTQVAERMKGG